MGNKDQNVARVWREIHDILLRVWDPIGINDCASAQDEYDSYIDEVYSLLLKAADLKSLDGLLFSIETKRMGLSGQNSRRIDAVRALLSIKLKT